MKPGEIVYTGTSKKGNPLVIRSIQKGDENIMADYINSISQEKTFVRFQGETISLNEETKYVEDQLIKLEKNETVQLLVFCHEKLIGVSDLNMGERVEKHVGIFGISLLREYRGEGVGKLLMELVIKQAEKHIPYLHIISLSVFSNNLVATEMYKNLGFVQYGSLPKGILHQGKYVDHNHMYKVIRNT